MSVNKPVPRRPVVLIILDGFGVNPSKRHNAVAQARTPNLDRYSASFPHTLIQASGPMVGLPDGQMGNSEVGHLTLGAGSIIKQDIVQINDAIEDGSFYANAAFLNAMARARQRGRPVHLLGLVSTGGVHSDLEHLKALIRLCKQQAVKPLVHMITDGRDTSPKSALGFLHAIEPLLTEAGGAVASVMGRYYAMDRDHRWERTELAWRCYVLGAGQKSPSADAAIRTAYHKGITDEFIRPVILPAFDRMQQDDAVISFNFRKDRPQQLVSALGLENFTGFDRGNSPRPAITCMMPYNKNWQLPAAFKPQLPLTCLAETISAQGLKQFHCSETEKYPHVTYFMNGGRTEPFSGETQLLIPSPRVATYDIKPEMSAEEVGKAVVKAINSDQYAFIVVNFPNGDMVGHTAVPEAVIKAVEALDKQVGYVIDSAIAKDYSVMLTADHGNCEEMVDAITGLPHTQHTLYPVPCMIIDKAAWQLSSIGGLANVAPTVLQLMGLKIPDAMTAKSLLIREVEIVDHEKNLDSVA